jgi:tetratricopeptide (TPR) repeat protein
LIGLPLLVLAVLGGVYGYQRWAKHNALRIARQWLDANRLDRAAAAIQDAIASEPDTPAPWHLASELAWRKGNHTVSVDYANKAAVVGEYDADLVLAWGEAAVLADDTAQARKATTYLDRAAKSTPRGERLLGELERRAGRFAAARDAFQAALDGDVAQGAQSTPMDDVPLGIVSLQTGEAADRARGKSLLRRWSTDLDWGTEALRALLGDAVSHGDKADMVAWAQALRRHPRCTLGDVPVCLQALAEADPPTYQAVLKVLEGLNGKTAVEAAQLLGWLTRIGRPDDAVAWAQSLDPTMAKKPPVAPAVAEALRATNRWAQLKDWLSQGDWGRDVGFMQWAYGFAAARHLGDTTGADSLWQSLYGDGRLSAAHAFFAGDLLYGWGYPKEAEELLWLAADRPDLAYTALGTLARLYQMQRDAEGQYRAFNRLNEMRPADRDIANNLAYYAALTDAGRQVRIEQLAEDNFAHEPGNLYYRCTYAFVLVWSGQAPRAMTLLDPVSHDWKKSPAVAFAYGAALANLGRKSEAREVFGSLNPANLNPKEIDWIRAAVR